MAKRRHFGIVRQRASGRWQVRYRGPDGRMRAAPETFARRVEAQRYLTLVGSQIARGEWTDPERARVTLGDYPSVDRGAGRAAVAHDRALRLAVAAAHHAVDRWGSGPEARHVLSNAA
jgi:hypothetical protein